MGKMNIEQVGGELKLPYLYFQYAVGALRLAALILVIAVCVKYLHRK